MNSRKAKIIFIVDDDQMLTEALTDVLTREVPHKVTAFHTGEECLKQLHKNPDIIILDYYLNTVEKDAANGMEILQIIKKRFPRIHVIMLSNQERYGVALQTIQKGAEQYVIKDKEAYKKIAQMIDKF
ncbi:MAG: response regulator [Fimbriimonadaceae bacterium]|nr:response regulator [Chitinophagales bacterium]